MTSLWRKVLAETVAGNCGFQYQKLNLKISTSVNFQHSLTKLCMVIAKLFSIIFCKFCITISAFEIQTSAMSEFYFRFRSRHFAAIGVSFCIRLPNFVQIGTSAAEIWRHIHFSRWRPRPLNTTSGFVFFDVAAFRRSKSISKPNFVEISQLAAEI